MRAQIVAGNWKMNNDQNETQSLLNELKKYNKPEKIRVIVAPAFTQLSQSVDLLKDDIITVAAQNMNLAVSGAHTGEISVNMLKGVGVNLVVLGHSERRSLYHENNLTLAGKVNTALEAGMEIIFCFGEQLEERKSNRHFNVVKEQLSEALFSLSVAAWSQIILAYEPVWAIGTGETASPDQAQEMHAYIRSLIQEHYNENLAQKVSILYGGSVNAENADTLLSQAEIDGALVGGASLKTDAFPQIVAAGS